MKMSLAHTSGSNFSTVTKPTYSMQLFFHLVYLPFFIWKSNKCKKKKTTTTTSKQTGIEKEVER